MCMRCNNLLYNDNINNNKFINEYKRRERNFAYIIVLHINKKKEKNKNSTEKDNLLIKFKNLLFTLLN